MAVFHNALAAAGIVLALWDIGYIIVHRRALLGRPKRRPRRK